MVHGGQPVPQLPLPAPLRSLFLPAVPSGTPQRALVHAGKSMHGFPLSSISKFVPAGLLACPSAHAPMAMIALSCCGSDPETKRLLHIEDWAAACRALQQCRQLWCTCKASPWPSALPSCPWARLCSHTPPSARHAPALLLTSVPFAGSPCCPPWPCLDAGDLGCRCKLLRPAACQMQSAAMSHLWGCRAAVSALQSSTPSSCPSHAGSLSNTAQATA